MIATDTPVIPILSRNDAIDKGAKRYFLGAPCPHGHTAEHYVITRRCVVCAQIDKKKWIEKYPDRQKATQASHYKNNTETYKNRSAAWRAAHPDKTYPRSKRDTKRERELERLRHKDNPEPFRVRTRNRRAARKKLGGTHSATDIVSILKMQKNRCAYCRAKFASSAREVDHIKPIVLGGTNDPKNLQILCRPCNRSKSGRDPIVFAQSRGMLL